MGFDMFIIKVPIFGGLIEKNIMARTTRTLGTLISSGVPILEALNITRETAGNGMFERMFGKVTEAIREGEVISKPLRENSTPLPPDGLVFLGADGLVPRHPTRSVAVTAVGTKLDDGSTLQTLNMISVYAIVMGVLGRVSST